MTSSLELSSRQRPGNPVETEGFIPYSRQWIDEDDIRTVVEVLRSDWLTTGPQVEAFEREFADFVAAGEAVAVSSGTAALHAAVHAAGIGPGDEVILSPLTFVATANAVVYQGGTPVFADVDPHTLLISPAQVEAKVSQATKAIIAVDYAGQPCDYDALRAVANRYSLVLIADACHSLGGSYNGRPVGSLADVSCFSFHPVKAITTGEGGMVTTDNPEWAHQMRTFRNHGITRDHRERERQGSWFYEMVDLGYNYRLTDFQCVLGLSQLKKLPSWVGRRREIAGHYDTAFAEIPAVEPLNVSPDVKHAYHLYVIGLNQDHLGADRTMIFKALRQEGLGVNVHYMPVHLHPFYQERFGTRAGLCPVAEAAYERIISLPLFPAMTPQDVHDTISATVKVLRYYRRRLTL